MNTDTQNTQQDVIIEGAMLVTRLGLEHSTKIETALLNFTRAVGSFEAGTESAARVRQIALAFVHEVEKEMFRECNSQESLENMAELSYVTFENYLQLVREWSAKVRNEQIELRIAASKKARA